MERKTASTRSSTPTSTDVSATELAIVLTDLRRATAEQNESNLHMLDELKKISDRMTGIGDFGSTFIEYRKTLHERFGKIHEQIGEMDEDIEKHDMRLDHLELDINTFKANWKLGIFVFALVVTIGSSILSSYGAAILRVIFH
jgi:hypothetical protein